MKKLLVVTLGLSAFIAFAFSSPVKKNTETPLLDEPLVITLEGIEDGEVATITNSEFLSETE